MRFQQVIHKVYGEPWQILPSSWYAIHQLVMAHWDDFSKLEADLEAKRPSTTWSGSPLDQFRVEQGVAIVPIKGSIVKGASMFAKSCGAVSHEDIHEDLDTIGSMGIRSVIFDVNSPGGMVMGTPEVSRRIGNLRREGVKTRVFSDQLIASAAYQMVAGADEIYTTPSATVGSIGTIWEFHNVARQLEEQGIEYNIFTSGPYKGLGHPARELSEDQKVWIQEHVDMHAEAFKDHVRNYRPKVKEDSMQGQSFTGEQGIKAGLVDGPVNKLQDVIDIAKADLR